MRQEIYDVMRFWIEKGADGFRLDAASMFYKDKGLPDGALGRGSVGEEHYQNVPAIHAYYREMYDQVLSRYPELVTVGETSGVTVEEAKKYAGFFES